MPKWAAGLSGSMTKASDHWIATSPMGKVRVYFTQKNSFGVIDHDVVLEDGKRFHNPLRVVPNGDGAEVIFSLFRQREMSDGEFDRDAGMVRADLERLKELLEAESDSK